MTQNNSSTGADSSLFIQKHSVPIRIWHWLTFILISASMITVLLNATLLQPWENIKMVQEQLKGKGVSVTEDQAFAVSHEYEDKVWNVHKWLGFGLAFLLLSRILIELVQPDEEKVRNRIRKVLGIYRRNDENKSEYRYYLGVRLTYLLFYALLMYMALTGLGLAFGRELSLSRSFHETLKEIHGLGQYIMYAFVLLHLCGVIIADNRKARGIVSGMIHGNA
jgi:Ni/Fe-hydrogenase 1 B-type cytochrome subunit